MSEGDGGWRGGREGGVGSGFEVRVAGLQWPSVKPQVSQQPLPALGEVAAQYRGLVFHRGALLFLECHIFF